MEWYVAGKAKALFDYIYFNQNKFSEITKNELEKVIEEIQKFEYS